MSGEYVELTDKNIEELFATGETIMRGIKITWDDILIHRDELEKLKKEE